MEAILRLLPDDALRSFEDFRGALFATMRGKAMHEERLRTGARHHARVHGEGAEGLLPRLRLGFEPHAGPHVGRHEMRALDRLHRVAELLEVRLVDVLAAFGGNAVARGRRDIQLEAEDLL